VAIVTGGARGIGAAICRRLAADGRAVAVLDLRASDCAAVVAEIEALGGVAAAFEADVSDETASQAAVDAVVASLGAPTILVNNAGITRDNLLFKMSTAEWTSVMDVHLKGAFLMSRAAQAHMVAARYGRIINLSSTSALGNRGQANYAAAKAGLQGFTKTLAIELGPFGITVNAVAPGFVETDMTAATAERMGVPWDEFRRRAIERIPVGRGGRPEDIAAAVGFFAGDDASYISGQVLYAAGGPRA
jgi:3-oxoacyl-[acyl-carrier protein] reductase